MNKKDNLSKFIDWVQIPSNQLFIFILFFMIPFTLATLIWFYNEININKKMDLHTKIFLTIIICFIGFVLGLIIANKFKP